MTLKSWIMFRQMIKQISRDMICVILIITPFLAGAFIRFGIPELEKFICMYFGKNEIITPYYYLFDWMISMLPGMMFLFTAGLIILGEIDDKIAGYMAVTPAGNSGYLFSRLGYPSIIAFAVDVLVLRLFALSSLSFADTIILSVSSSLIGVLTALLVIAISSNKVEGMAIGKLSGLVGLGMFIPVIFDGPGQYIAAVLPSYWIGRFLIDKNYIFIIAFAGCYLVWIDLLLRKYKLKKM